MARLRFRMLLTIGLLLTQNTIAGASVSAETELESLLTQYSRLQAEFSQQTIEADGYVLDVQTGTLAVSRPDKLNWLVDAPYRQQLVSDGVKIYMHDPDLMQVTIRDWSQDPAINPAVMLAGNVSLKQYFSIEMIVDDGGSDSTYQLTPKNTGGVIERIRISFTEDGAPGSLEIVDSVGQTTRIDLRNVEIDPEFEPLLFEFSIPENSDVYYAD